MAHDDKSATRSLRVAQLVRTIARDYDFTLVIATIAAAILIGALFVAATVYSFFAAQADPAWTETYMYASYIDAMNSYLFPLLLTLIVMLGLCIPRRVFKRWVLAISSAGLLLVTLLIIASVGWRAGWLFLLASASILQLVVIVMTAIRSPRLTYLQESFLIRMGSAMLHLGLIVLIAAFVLQPGRTAQLAAFWIATTLVMVGMIMSFYGGELGALSLHLRHHPTSKQDVEED